MSPTREQTVAAVDLGSNSFHMVVAQVADGELRIVDRLRETVRLGAGLDRDKRLTDTAAAAALGCLQRFGDRVRDLPPGSVRAVGTNTLRQARNSASFLRRAAGALGHRIEVISGFEEARLIHLGVASGLAGDAQRLVIDIGGGSTELIIGRGLEPLQMESLHMGCVSMSLTHFPDGKVGRKAWRHAVLAARRELEPHEASYRARGWSEALGASGSVRAVGDVARAAGWSNGAITRDVLARIEDRLLEAGEVGKAALPGLSEDRRPVFVGGVAILTGLFEALGLERLQVASGALREGLLFDLVGRLGRTDVRAATVRGMASRYGVDPAHAARVEASARALLAQVIEPWGLQAPPHGQLLGWAAQLHEVGIAVSHSQYQKHGAYLLEHGDLAGFSRDEQSVLAALVRVHRRKFPKDAFERLPAPWDRKARRLAVILRVAVLLNRARSAQAPTLPRAEAFAESFRLGFTDGQLDQHPLLRADLEEEAGYLAAAGIEFRFG
jgi:exopolyphosphatase/guanosine-5'-triphosphate,3'-diphosphate pyrophosphatase